MSHRTWRSEEFVRALEELSEERRYRADMTAMHEVFCGVEVEFVPWTVDTTSAAIVGLLTYGADELAKYKQWLGPECNGFEFKTELAPTSQHEERLKDRIEDVRRVLEPLKTSLVVGSHGDTVVFPFDYAFSKEQQFKQFVTTLPPGTFPPETLNVQFNYSFSPTITSSDIAALPFPPASTTPVPPISLGSNSEKEQKLLRFSTNGPSVPDRASSLRVLQVLQVLEPLLIPRFCKRWYRKFCFGHAKLSEDFFDTSHTDDDGRHLTEEPHRMNLKVYDAVNNKEIRERYNVPPSDTNTTEDDNDHSLLMNGEADFRYTEKGRTAPFTAEVRFTGMMEPLVTRVGEFNTIVSNIRSRNMRASSPLHDFDTTDVTTYVEACFFAFYGTTEETRKEYNLGASEDGTVPADYNLGANEDDTVPADYMTLLGIVGLEVNGSTYRECVDSLIRESAPHNDAKRQRTDPGKPAA